ncbi:MAG: hypothetical protein IJA61_00160 [Clostridia bacterium]|nr:hypothetical protein [Clostridia bacterium]
MFTFEAKVTKLWGCDFPRPHKRFFLTCGSQSFWFKKFAKQIVDTDIRLVSEQSCVLSSVTTQMLFKIILNLQYLNNIKNTFLLICKLLVIDKEKQK